MKPSDVDLFEKLIAQLKSLHRELSVLAKKSPNDVVNTFKLRFINATLLRCNDMLGDRYRPFPDFETFEEDKLPSNSDATFILSQYIECGEKLRADNIKFERSRWVWNIEGEEMVRTSPPKKLSND